LKALYTPGHCTDHFSLLMTHPKLTQRYLFSGDIILGTPSTSVQDLSDYMESLYNLRKEDFDYICLPHSVEIKEEEIIVEGKKKLEEYIKYREDREVLIK